jgi:predicted permease
MNLRDLKLRARALLASRSVERELDEELAFHLDRETEKHLASGLSAADARARARASFGPVALAADECRDARGTALVDSVVRDIRYAVGAFRRAPLTALTIIATVALGLALVAVVFTFYSALFLRVDAVRNPGELFEVRRLPFPGGDGNTYVQITRPQYEALRRDTSVFADTVAMVSGIAIRVDGRAIRGALVDGNFFQVVGVKAALGRALTPADDGRLAGRPVVVLSHRGWNKLFPGDTGVIGRSLIVNGAPYEIVGVMPPEFRGLDTAPPDYWAPLSLVGQFQHAYAGQEDKIPLEVVGRLKPEMSAEAATAVLSAWAAGNPDLVAVNGRPKTIKLLPRQGTISPDVIRGLLVFSPIFFAFGLVLMIGCANVANLLLARGVSRQREIGIRLSLGASRGRVIRQLLTESLLLALVSAACALAISRLMLAAAVHLAVSALPPQLAEWVNLADPVADWRVVLFLLLGAIVSTAFFGLAPALQATRFQLVRTMRGDVMTDVRPSRARNALIALQAGASALLLICAAVFLRSELAAASIKPGLRITDTVSVEIPNERFRAAILQAVSADPSVARTAASWPPVLSSAQASAKASITVPVDYKFVSPDYFSLLDIEIVKGRGFAASERTAEAGMVVVSETVARRLWPDRSAVGEVVRLEAWRRVTVANTAVPDLPLRAFTVVGVVRDVSLGSGMFEQRDAGVYLPIAPESQGTSLVLRVHGDPELARLGLMDRLARIDPAIAAITTVRAMGVVGTYVLQLAFSVTAVLGGLALLLTLSGIFGVLSYVVEQRRQEIGVRLALGATSRNIVRLVLAQSVRPVAVGLIAGGALAAALATLLMSTSAASQIGKIVHVFDPLAYAASLLCIITACLFAALIPALRAARIDPMVSLRQD